MNRLFTRPLPQVDISRDQYARFREALAPDSRLPVEFGQWARESARTEMIHQAARWNTVRIAVDFEEFQAFAEAAKLPLTYGLLHAYAYQKWLHQARPSRGPLP